MVSSVTAEFSTGHRFLPILFVFLHKVKVIDTELMVTPSYIFLFSVKNLLCMFRAFLSLQSMKVKEET